MLEVQTLEIHLFNNVEMVAIVVDIVAITVPIFEATLRVAILATRVAIRATSHVEASNKFRSKSYRSMAIQNLRDHCQWL